MLFYNNFVITLNHCVIILNHMWLIENCVRQYMVNCSRRPRSDSLIAKTRRRWWTVFRKWWNVTRTPRFSPDRLEHWERENKKFPFHWSTDVRHRISTDLPTTVGEYMHQNTKDGNYTKKIHKNPIFTIWKTLTPSSSSDLGLLGLDHMDSGRTHRWQTVSEGRWLLTKMSRPDMKWPDSAEAETEMVVAESLRYPWEIALLFNFYLLFKCYASLKLTTFQRKIIRDTSLLCVIYEYVYLVQYEICVWDVFAQNNSGSLV